MEHARIMKKGSKEKAIAENGRLVIVVFHLQRVIHLPISQESSLFYEQRFFFLQFHDL